MKKSKLQGIIAVLLVMIGVMVSCDYMPILYQERAINSSQRKLVDFGNGVYRFSYSQLQFGCELANFINEHPKLELVSFSCIEENDSEGCIVVFRGKRDTAN
jgi:hypothetical protein